MSNTQKDTKEVISDIPLLTIRPRAPTYESWIFSCWWHSGSSASPSAYPGMPADISLMSNAVWMNTHTLTHSHTLALTRNASLNWHFKQSFCLVPDSYSSLLPPLLLFLLLSLSPSLLPVIPKHSLYPLIPSLFPTHIRALAHCKQIQGFFSPPNWAAWLNAG